jgi:hypothetical protein
LNVLKDKALAKAYPGLTDDVVRAAFPGLLPEKQAETVTETKRPAGRPRKVVA